VIGMSDPEHTVALDDTRRNAPESPSAAVAKSDAATAEQRSRPRHLCGKITLTKVTLEATADATYFAWARHARGDLAARHARGDLAAKNWRVLWLQ
jgi:hypothetical protein